jgi:hypothetical protein
MNVGLVVGLAMQGWGLAFFVVRFQPTCLWVINESFAG